LILPYRRYFRSGMNIKSFEEKVGINFKNKGLIEQAFIHRSYINENRKTKLEHNERLEFLGDAVLELITTEYLYKKYPSKTEGDLTSYRASLVNADTLSRVANDLSMNDYLLLSKGEAQDMGRARHYILANTIEAVIGAIYLDQGMAMAKKFVEQYITPLIDDIVANKAWIDKKSLFQEKAQDIVGITPTYRVLKEIGPDHDKNFTVGVYLKNEQVAVGTGRSKQDAEQNAAALALKEKKWE